jgi:hypothetical protein
VFEEAARFNIEEEEDKALAEEAARFKGVTSLSATETAIAAAARRVGGAEPRRFLAAGGAMVKREEGTLVGAWVPQKTQPFLGGEGLQRPQEENYEQTMAQKSDEKKG